MLAGTVKAKLFQLLEGLVEYTEVHFAYEERLMQQAGYPEFAAHKAQHDDLSRRGRGFRKISRRAVSPPELPCCSS